MTDDRLRTPPSERFTGDTHFFSLPTLLNELRDEKHPSHNGHRQITLLHRPGVTQVLFSFEAGGKLDEHATPGLVTIHVLEGRLSVEASGAKRDLAAGELIVLDPEVPHDVRAREEAAMLLTVHLTP